MDVRTAERGDGDAIRTVAEQSLSASYTLSPTVIEQAVENWYGEDALDEKFADPDSRLLVAEADGDVVAFSESLIVDAQGDILWLHVAPSHRGRGIGKALYEQTRETLDEAGAEVVRGLVLADNAEGNEFYEEQGLVKAGEDSVEIGGNTHVENVYIEDGPAPLEPITADGRELYVDHTDADRGSDGPFLTVYADRDRERRYGAFCAVCDSLVTTMDTMGRMQCDCGNVRRPTRWDAAYM
ncbi:GNAT family N-acetyltransferase [Natronomonas sp. EA1]|uniref:GNAT family N-acetyltransferase n=1 Tax=Natronomonas sp. EA1 TaxID=3421655 RepID=UPI003EC01495